MMAGKDVFQYTCTLSQETLDVARDELKEDPSTRLLELKTLRDRLQQYPGLKARLDPQFLIRFLRARKFDQEKAFEMVLNYYRMRKEDPTIFTGLKPSNLPHVFCSNIAFPLPHRDKLGRKIYLIHPGRIDTNHYTMTEVFMVEFLNMSKMIEDEENQVRGFTLMVDYANFGMGDFLAKLTSDVIRKGSRLWSDTFPARMRCCLIINEPHFMDMVMGLFAQLVKAKLMRRIHRIGTDWDKLHEFIDPACLPACYGGTLQEEVVAKIWEDEMMKSDREMEEEGKFGFVDYTLRADQERKQEDAFSSMAGTFKKLDL